LKRIIILYYTQSGQLKDIVDSILKPFKVDENIEIVYEKITPELPYPFPWKILSFFDSFPESVSNIPCKIEPLKFDSNQRFDLIIFAYQIWYLNPSIPSISALYEQKFQFIVKNTPVITVIGCRNMWILAQEKVKNLIYNAGGKLVGNIVLIDRSPNLIGIVTIVYWLIFGKKNRFLGIFPKPGVSKKDIDNCQIFGETILNDFKYNDFSQLQNKLINQKAVKISSGLLIFEQRISRIFKIWAKFILKSGNAGDKKRIPKLYFFIVYLILAIIILAPVSTIISAIYLLFRKNSTKKDVEYYSNVFLNFKKNN